MWQMKNVIALVMLVICAYTDIKERNIYIMPLIISTTGATAISVVSFMCAPATSDLHILMSDLLLPAFAGALMIFVARSGRAHMGQGDGYLMAALGMMIGLRSNICVIAAAACAALFYVILLLFKNGGYRRIRRKSIPFAPFMTAGYMFVLINGMIIQR